MRLEIAARQGPLLGGDGLFPLLGGSRPGSPGFHLDFISAFILDAFWKQKETLIAFKSESESETSTDEEDEPIRKKSKITDKDHSKRLRESLRPRTQKVNYKLEFEFDSDWKNCFVWKF